MNARLLLRRSVAGWLAALATTTAVAQVTVSPSPGSLPQPVTSSPTGNVLDVDPLASSVFDEETLAAAAEAAESARLIVAILDVPLRLEGLPVAMLKQGAARQAQVPIDQARVEVSLKCFLTVVRNGVSENVAGWIFRSEKFEVPSSGDWQGTVRLEIRNNKDDQVSWTSRLFRADAEVRFDCRLVLNEYDIVRYSDTLRLGSYTTGFRGIFRNGEWIQLSREWLGEPAADEGSVLVSEGYFTTEKMIDLAPRP